MTSTEQHTDKATSQPRVTIVTVAYNAGQLLEKTLADIARQQYPEKELVVVDGNSSDGSVDTIRRYAEEGVVTRWVSEPDGGIYDAMNKGVGMSTGEWVIFMNAGDVFASRDVLQRVFGSGHGDADVVYGDVVKDGAVKKAPASYRLYHRMLFCHQCVFARRRCLLQTPFDTRHKLSADYKFFLQQFQLGARFEYVAEPIAVFDTGGVSNRQRSRGLRDNISVVWETVPMPLRLKFLLRLAVPYVMCRLRGK